MSNNRRTPAKRAQRAPRRRMAALPPTLTGRRRAARRKMNGKNNLQDTAVSIAQVAGGMVLGAFVPQIVRKVAPNTTINPHLINGITVAVGVGVGMAMPNLKKVGIGMAAGAVANSVAIAVPQIGGAMTGGHTRRVRDLAPAERKQLQEAIEKSAREMRGGMPETLTGRGWADGASYG